MAKKIEFKVFARKNGTECVIRPPFDNFVKTGGGHPTGFTIHNKTPKEILLLGLPDGVFDFTAIPDGNADPGQTVTVPAGQTILRIGTNAAEGLFQFKVFCLETMSFAQGNSDPEFIIE